MARYEELVVNELTLNKMVAGSDVGSSSTVRFQFPDAFLGKAIQTGTYSSSASKGITLSADNTRPVSFLFDDAGAVMTGDIRGVLSRVVSSALHTGSLTLNAMRGHIKFVDGVDFDADYADAVRGYIEIAGATDFDLNSDDHCVSALHGRVEVAASMAIQQGFLTGCYLELNTTGAYSVTQDADGILAGMVITITDQKNDAWGHGIYIAASAVDTGITINAATTGISLAGAMTTGLNIGGATTEAINITGNATRAINIDTGTIGTGITIGGTLTTGISVGACTQILDITGAISGLGIDFGPGWGGTSSANGLIMGGGTSGDPMTTSTADKFFMEFRTESQATSGTSRCLYMRHALNDSGNAISGEALRAFTKLTDSASTARGAHISLDAAATKGISGLGAGVDAQILVGDGAMPAGGTYACLNMEWYAAGSSVDISGVTKASFMRAVLGGDDTGNDNIEDKVNLIEITGGSNASGNMVGAAGNEPTWASNTYLIRCDLNGQAAFLVAVKV